jgi:hypothetical protein
MKFPFFHIFYGEARFRISNISKYYHCLIFITLSFGADFDVITLDLSKCDRVLCNKKHSNLDFLWSLTPQE